MENQGKRKRGVHEEHKESFNSYDIQKSSKTWNESKKLARDKQAWERFIWGLVILRRCEKDDDNVEEDGDLATSSFRLFKH